MTDPSSPPSLYLISGAAGTGKTTLVRSLGYDLVDDFNLSILAHIPSTPLDARLLGPLVDPKNPARIVVIVRHAAEYVRDIEQFMNDAANMKLPVSVILEERRNQWIAARTHEEPDHHGGGRSRASVRG